MALLNTYLNFNGNTEEAFSFYKSVFGGEFQLLSRFEDNPGACEGLPEGEHKGIMHVALPIGKHSLLMGTDVPSVMPQVITGTNMSISVDADSRDEADRLFAGLAEGGTIQMPLQTMFWGAYFGMLTDKFGIQWMMNFDDRQH
ncbi:MAG: VOC family protein [Pedobacter sp.]|nr:VOC family protein [Pedobacter sp.]MDQ8053231.1 VOC family protein [Pedobacter sp.]